MIFRPMPVLTIFSFLSLVVLVWLGNWQYARYTEKIDQPGEVAAVIDARQLEFEVLVDTPWQAAAVYGVIDSEPVWRRYVPAVEAQTRQFALVLWDATGGPVPVALTNKDVEPVWAGKGNLFVRGTGKSRFGFEDKPDEGVWYTYNGEQMARYLGRPEETAPRVFETLNLTVRNAENLAQARLTKNPYAFATPIDPLPPERHFGYALTWWGMALGLFGVYAAFHHSKGRLRFRS